ncbi:hypothetical protein ACM01_04040 [Streptomyces viridochromogenes]|uniref:Uncharacterized protein n=1 Tax=Streptomyces viridochromogenes TaxID=1938 RepID=A0A0J7ZM24_STRVR|nr:hypothetical protein ACM01_04040 [Streptomyces viridochromogenes]
MEDPALGLPGVEGRGRAQSLLQIQPCLRVDETGTGGEQGTAAGVFDGGAVRIEVLGQQDQCAQDASAVAAAGEFGEER